MSDTTPLDVDAIRAKANDATVNPWKRDAIGWVAYVHDVPALLDALATSERDLAAARAALRTALDELCTDAQAVFKVAYAVDTLRAALGDASTGATK